MNNELILKQWAKLGAVFDVSPAESTPDIEALLIDTAFVVPENAELFAVAASWLCVYYRLVCRHRLAGMASRIENPDVSAALGLLLETAKKFADTDHFNLPIKQCRPLVAAKPLFVADRRTEQLALSARANSSPAALGWGVWCQAVSTKKGAIRPIAWVMSQNPRLKQRAVFSGNLRVSILEALAREPESGQSESVLSRYCYATRKAVREALDHLEFCQLVCRRYLGGKVQITLCDVELSSPVGGI